TLEPAELESRRHCESVIDEAQCRVLVGGDEGRHPSQTRLAIGDPADRQQQSRGLELCTHLQSRAPGIFRAGSRCSTQPAEDLALQDLHGATVISVARRLPKPDDLDVVPEAWQPSVARELLRESQYSAALFKTF